MDYVILGTLTIFIQIFQECTPNDTFAAIFTKDMSYEFISLSRIRASETVGNVHCTVDIAWVTQRGRGRERGGRGREGEGDGETERRRERVCRVALY